MKLLNPLRFAAPAMLLVSAAVWLCACGTPQPVHYPVVIEPQAEGSIMVDVIGIKKSDLADWDSLPVSKYWQPEDMHRRDAQPDMLSFKIAKGHQFRIEPANPIWQRWKQRNVTHLLVLADLPGVVEDPPRRKVLSLFENDWAKGTKTLSVEIQQSRVNILTSPAPEK